jgi:hypothetical protein
VTASLCGSGYDAQIEVHTGAGCPGDSLIICRDDWYCGPDWMLTPSVAFDAFPGNTYWILVGGFYGNTGAYTLNVDAITCPVIPEVVDMVGQADFVNGNMNLSWQPVDPCDYYEIRWSAVPPNPTIPGNPVDIEYGTSYTHVNAINDFARLYYQITAVDLPEAPGGEPMLMDKPIPPSPHIPSFDHLPPYDYSGSQNK